MASTTQDILPEDTVLIDGPEKEYIICTHSDRFHCDEVTAVAVLKKIFKIITVVRTRDPEQLNKYQAQDNVFVVDVGKVYDHHKLCYDHHQVEFNEDIRGQKPLSSLVALCYGQALHIPLSSSGLIYRHYHKQLLDHYLDQLSSTWIDRSLVTEEMYKSMRNAVYHRIFKAIDANDNGINMLDKGMSARYPVTTLPAMVAAYNHFDSYNHNKQAQRFDQAVKMVGEFLDFRIPSILHDEFNYNLDHQEIQNVLRETEGGVLKLTTKPRTDINKHLKYLDDSHQIKFVTCPIDGKWALWTVRPDPSSFDLLAPLMDEAEAKAEHGEKVIFIHAKHFTGKAEDEETAMAVLNTSLEQYEAKKKAETELITPEVDKRTSWYDWMSYVTFRAAGITGLAFILARWWKN